MITYKFNKEKDIIETLIKGDTSIKDLTEYILKLSEDEHLPKKLKILSDARNGNFTSDTETDDLEKIVEANYRSLAVRDVIYDAFVLSSPVETAMGQLYKEFSKADNYFFNIFSTKEAAEEWLNQF